MAKSEVDHQVVDKAALLAATEFETADVEIPKMGYVTVRGMSRAELHRVRTLGEDKGLKTAEAFMVERAVVEPKFTADEVEQWFKKPAGRYIDRIVEKINDLSGVEEGAGKEATERFLE